MTNENGGSANPKRAAAIVTLASFVLTWGTLATLFYVEPDDDDLYGWALALLFIVIASAWWTFSAHLEPDASTRQRLRVTCWGAATLVAWVLVPFITVAILYGPVAMAGAVGAGHGSHGGTRVLVVLVAMATGTWTSWKCARRAVRAMNVASHRPAAATT